MANIFFLVESVSGFWLLLRTLNFQHRSSLEREIFLAKIGTFYFIWAVLARFLKARSCFSTVLWIFFPIFAVEMTSYIRRNWPSARLEEQFYFFISEVILQMRSGRSFRDSLKMCLSRQSSFFLRQISPLIEAIVFSRNPDIPDKSVFTAEALEFLQKIDRQSHKGLSILVFWRRKLKIERDFRHRSRLVTQQIRLQAVLLLVLYALLLAFVLHNYGFRPHSVLILVSIVFFILGEIGIFLVGRSFRWKY